MYSPASSLLDPILMNKNQNKNETKEVQKVLQKASAALANKPKQKRKRNRPSIGARSVANIRGGGPQQQQRFQAPVAMGTIVGGNARRELFRVGPRREYLADVIGNTVAFGLVASLAINPGQVKTFPWLSSIAANYDMYRFVRLRFLYINRTTTANTGEVTMAFDPDPADNAPASDLQALQYEAMKTCSPWEDMALEVPRSDLNRLPKYFCRASVVSSELETYDTGVLHLITGGNTAAGGKIGQLFAEYEVEFYAPQVAATAASTARFTSDFAATATALAAAGTVQIPFPTVVFNGLGLTPGNTYSGMSGTFSIYCQVTISSIVGFTSAFLLIRKNGAGIATSAYPAPVGGISTSNLFQLAQLVPTDVIDVAITSTLTSGAVVGGVTTSMLIFAPA